MMDLNEFPSDHILNTVELDGRFEGNLEASRSRFGGVAEQKCREVEEQSLALELEIRKKNMDLDAIRVRVRGLEGEKAAVGEEIEALKEKKADLEGAGAGVDGEKMDRGEVSLDDGNMESVDELMIENKVLECEKMRALKEVEDWKRKCKELESRVVELEGRLGKAIMSNAMKEAAINGDHAIGSGDLGSPSRTHGARDGRVQTEETPENRQVLVEESQPERVQHGSHGKKLLVFQNARICDRKLAPATPEVAINIIDSDDDNEHQCPDKYGPSFQSRGTPSLPKRVHVDEKVGIFDVEESSNCEGNVLFIPTPKRKRGPKVVLSDDESEDDEGATQKRPLKIDGIETEDEDDDAIPIKRIFYTGNGNCKSDCEEEEKEKDDDIPISQLKLKSAQSSSQHIARCTRSRSSAQAGNVTQSQTRPRRRLVKSQQGEEKCKTEETENNSEMVTTENVEDDELGEDGPDSDADSLRSFIDDDSDTEDVEENVSEDGSEHSDELEDDSDSNLDFRDIISRLQRKKDPASKWVLEGDMLSDFGKDPELCMRAVCALYRQQTADEKRCKESIFQNGRGFSKFDASRGTKLGEFLTDRDQNGDLVKSVEDLQEHDPCGVEACCRLAKHYSKQLFEIYKNQEDPFFPPP